MARRRPLARWLTRRFGHRLEAAVVRLLLALFGALPVDRASALGGWIGRRLGPLLPATATARANLLRAMPDLEPGRVAAILQAMWDNLGRTMAEYPHLGEIAGLAPGGRCEVVGAERIADLAADGKAGILVSAHLANWEVLPMAARRLGLEIAIVYRAPNNPLVDQVLADLRRPSSATLVPKGPEGARRLLRHLAQGGHAGLLIDQKMNDGIPVPFFGRLAMTAPAAAQLALRWRLPLVPALTERLEGARFRITVLAPLELPDSGDRVADTALVMERLNRILEEHVRAHPAQWLWAHRRWPD